MTDLICYNCMASLADYSLDASDHEYIAHGVRRKNKNELVPSNLKDYDVIFVKTDFIVNGIFQRDFLGKIKTKFILITGTSDYSLDINENFKVVLNNPNLVHWFACNPPSNSYEKISFIPIGFQEYERLKSNLEFLKSDTETINWEMKINKLYIPYHSNTNNQRNSIINNLSKLPYVDIETEKLNFVDYIKKIKKYKFILSLRGNGWDTHRNYEIIHCNSVPVLQNGPITQSFIDEKIPFVYLDEINDSIFNKKFHIDKNILSINYWSNKIRNVRE